MEFKLLDEPDTRIIPSDLCPLLILGLLLASLAQWPTVPGTGDRSSTLHCGWWRGYAPVSKMSVGETT
jgi:hypothetical protein